MAGFAMGVGTGFFSKAASIQDENRKLENDMLKEDFLEFNKSLSVYRAAKSKQAEQDNVSRGFAFQISGDPRDQMAMDIARSFVSSGHDIKDPIVLAQAQSQYKASRDKKALETNGGGVAGVGTPPVNVASPNQPIPNAPQAPGLGGPAPQGAPLDTPQGQVAAPTTGQKVGNIMFGKSSPEQFQAKSLKNIAGRTGMTPEQVTAIRTGADTGQDKFNPTTTASPINPGNAMLIHSAMKMAGEGKIKDTAGFFKAINEGDFVGAGKFLPTTEEQNAWHIEAAKIQAQASRDNAATQAAATRYSADKQLEGATARNENSTPERYARASEAFDNKLIELQENPQILSQYPGVDPNNKDQIEWVAIQELRKTNPGIVGVLQNGPTGNRRLGPMEQLMPGKYSTTMPGAKKDAKPGDKPTSVTEPPAPTAARLPQEEARLVAEQIKKIKDPAKQEEAKKRFLKDYPKYYTENFLPEEQKKKDTKNKTSDKEEENNRAMKSLKNTNVKDMNE